MLAWCQHCHFELASDMPAAPCADGGWAPTVLKLLCACVAMGAVAVGGASTGGGAPPRPTERGGLRRLQEGLTSLVFIGDLHADADCARQAVRSSGLVDLDAAPWAWTGGDDAAIVFLGDYVDKGSAGRAVLELVRALEVRARAGRLPFSPGTVRRGQPLRHMACLGTASRTSRAAPPSSQAAFPAHVVALLGNHDLFMLLDATLPAGADRCGAGCKRA